LVVDTLKQQLIGKYTNASLMNEVMQAIDNEISISKDIIDAAYVEPAETLRELAIKKSQSAA
jgi:hypothetical protein